MSSREPSGPRTAVTVSAHAGQDGPSGEAPVRIGRYVVAGPIGRGGMGVVYLARDEMLGRRVALKLLDSGAAGATQQARLLQEAQALARLAHPNVVTVHEAGEHAGRIFLAMEFVPGDTLRAWQRERERDRAELLAVAMQAGRGLAAAHDAGLVHRDVKPDNIMVGVDGRVRVMDFGLARLARTLAGDDELASPAPSGPLTQVGAVIGTPGYMAPEQRRGAVVDPSGDIYSFCVVLYELLAGERPGGEPPEAVLVRRGVPAWLAAVVARGLLDDPTARWPTMHALLDALEQDPIARRRRRLRIAGIVALTGLVAAALVLGGLAWRASILRARAEQVAADRLAAIGQVEDPEAAFAAFVADPAHRGTRAVAQAWLRRGDEARAAGRGDAAIAAYARAYVDAVHPDDVTATLRSLAAATHADGDGLALAPVVAELRARGVDDDELRAQAVFAALALRDLPGALADTPADSPWRPLLTALAAGRPHSMELLPPVYALPPGGPAAYAVGSPSGETVLLDDRLAEVGRRPFGEWHLVPGTTRKMVRGTDLIDLDAPDVVLWRAEHQVAYDATLRPGPGRPPVLVFQYIWPHLGFYRLVEARGQPLAAAVAHAGTHAADTAWDAAWSGDLDGDGRDELVAGFESTYDLRVFDLDDEGALRLRWRGPAGLVSGIAGVRRGDERLVAVARDALHPAPGEYPEPPHLGGPVGFELLRWDGEALRPVAHVPLPRPDIRMVPRRLLTADLDGDGDDELIRELLPRQGPRPPARAGDRRRRRGADDRRVRPPSGGAERRRPRGRARRPSAARGGCVGPGRRRDRDAGPAVGARPGRDRPRRRPMARRAHRPRRGAGRHGPRPRGRPGLRRPRPHDRRSRRPRPPARPRRRPVVGGRRRRAGARDRRAPRRRPATRRGRTGPQRRGAGPPRPPRRGPRRGRPPRRSPGAQRRRGRASRRPDRPPGAARPPGCPTRTSTSPTSAAGTSSAPPACAAAQRVASSR
ncbi:protein kinase domain-containing protein [Nannocystis pusilla]|uniref:serine/threonine-protein kinase n=1 Tax=Nannocystis pusilla TaxID=889268 RepID=UPI003DA6CCEA